MIFPIIHTTSREPVESPVDKVIAHGETIHLGHHSTLISRNGTEYQIDDSIAPIRDNQNILGMVLVFNDVTERYRLREAAAKSEEQVRLLLDSTAEAIYGIDNTGKCTFVNHACLDMLGYENDSELLDKNMHELIHYYYPDGSHYPVDKSHIHQAFREGHGTHIDNEVFWRKDDSSFAAEYWSHPIFNKGDCVGTVITFLDITEKIHAEESLRRSQKMDALGKLTGGIAHDYNNLLGIIMGYTEQLNEQLNHEPKLERYAAGIQRAAKRGAKLTQKLLAFTRHKGSDASVLNINTLLKEQRLMLEKTLTARISLTLDLADNLWPGFLDSSDLEDVIINLSINPMHAIEGTGQLTLRTHNEQLNAMDAQQLHLQAGDYILFSITDTGCGMDKETKAKIFDPFFSTKGEQGSGLGLSQVYGFVKRSGGAVKVYSEPGHGSRFAFYFPRCHKTAVTTQADTPIEEQSLGGKETLLVVDDEPDLMNLAQDILSSQGYQVLTASDGEQALQVLKKQSVDLVVSDVIMPNMDGYQLATRMQQDYPHIKLQMVSGFTDDRYNQMENNAAHHNLLYKPYTSHALLSRVRQLLDEDNMLAERTI